MTGVKKVVVLVNKADMLSTVHERQKIRDFVEENARLLFLQRPPVFLLSAREERRARTESGVADAGFKEFEEFLKSSLLSKARQRVRLEGPLGVAAKLASIVEAALEKMLDQLSVDTRLLAKVADDTSALGEEMRQDMESLKDRLENMLLRLTERAEEFVSQRLRLVDFPSLLRKDSLKLEFERCVIGDVAKDVDAEVRNASERFAQKVDKHAQRVLEAVQRRMQDRNSNSPEQLSVFIARDKQLQELSQAASLVGNEFRGDAATERLTEHVRTSLAATFAFEFSALGMGVLVMISSLDLKTLGLASGLAVSGFGVLPVRNMFLSQEFRTGIETTIKSLRMALDAQGDRAITSTAQRIESAIEPYQRAVAVEVRTLKRRQEEVIAVQSELERIRAGIPKALES